MSKADVVLRIHTEAPQVVDPDTGEIVLLANAKPVVLAAVLAVIAEQMDDLTAAKAIVGREAISRMDRGGEWTISARGVKVSAPSPSAATVSWDAELLDSILADLVKEELIDQDARLRACSTRIETVTHAAGITKLMKIPAVADRIVLARTTHEPPARRVSVKRDGTR